jgi:hypothetical protein
LVLSSTEGMYFIICGKQFPVFHYKEEETKNILQG